MARAELTETVFQPQGSILTYVNGASVTVNVRGGGTATVYQTATGGATYPQPLTTAYGRIEPVGVPGGECWLDSGSYDVVVTFGAQTWTQRVEISSGMDGAAMVLGNLGASVTTTPTGRAQHFMGTLTADTAITVPTITAGDRVKLTLTQDIRGYWAPTITYGAATAALPVEKGQDAVTMFECTSPNGTDLYVNRIGRARSNILFTASNRSYKDVWKGYDAASKTRFADVASPFRAGKIATQVTLIDGDVYGHSDDFNADPSSFVSGASTSRERAELSTANPVGPHSLLHYEGEEIWLGFGLWIPNAAVFGNTFTIIWQGKQVGGGGSPEIVFNILNATPPRLGLWTSDTTADVLALREKWFGGASRESWVKMLLNVRLHRDPSIGFYQVWGDLTGSGTITALSAKMKGISMKDTDTVTYPDEIVPRLHHRIGVYRDPAISGDLSLIFDGFTVGYDRAAVEALAFS